MENYLIQQVVSNAGKNHFCILGELLSASKVEQSLKAVPLSAYCNQLQDFTLSSY